LSFVALVSLFAFLGNSENYKLPDVNIPLTTVDFSVSALGQACDVSNFSVATPTCREYSVQSMKIGKHFIGYAQAHGDPINYSYIPFGVYLYRDDLKTTYYYPFTVDSSTATDERYRCENRGKATTEDMLQNFMKYIDLGALVRGQEVFTTKVPDAWNPTIVRYSYTETKDITNEKYDKVNITYTYTVNTLYANVTTRRETRYYRHLKDGDFELTPYATEYLDASDLDNDLVIFDWELYLAWNKYSAENEEYRCNVMEKTLNLDISTIYPVSISLVCPEIDHLPVPSLTELLPNNYTEYRLIFENPVCIKKLMESLADVLNLTSTHPERVAYSGIEKIEKEWAVDVIMPTDLGEILSTAVLNRDVKKSGYELVGKIVRMVSKKSGK